MLVILPVDTCILPTLDKPVRSPMSYHYGAVSAAVPVCDSLSVMERHKRKHALHKKLPGSKPIRSDIKLDTGDNLQKLQCCETKMSPGRVTAAPCRLLSMSPGMESVASTMSLPDTSNKQRHGGTLPSGRVFVVFVIEWSSNLTSSMTTPFAEK